MIIKLLIIGSVNTSKMVLPFHLPDIPIEFGFSDVTTLTLSKLKFSTWMKCNSIYPVAKRYLYSEYPTAFVWDYRFEIGNLDIGLLSVDFSLLNVLKVLVNFTTYVRCYMSLEVHAPTLIL